MRTIVLFTAALVLWAGNFTTVLSQEKTSWEKMEEAVVEEEKSALRKEVEAINKQLEKELISFEEAEQLKKEAAEKRAKNIDNRLAIISNQKELSERNDPDSLVESRFGFDPGREAAGEDLILGVKIKNRKKEIRYDRRTTTGFNLAFGLNNAITQGESFDRSPFRIGGSRFFEMGWTAKTRILENSNWVRVKYGIAFQFNGLKPVDNQYFVDTGSETVLEVFPHHLKKSKFRMDNLVVPVHFEFGPSKKIVKEDYFRYSTFNKPAFGIGGYAGVNLSSRQKLKYREDGRRQKEKLKQDYNTSNLIYGISGYVTWRKAGLYVKYDLNPIFTGNPADQRNISVGLRFDSN